MERKDLIGNDVEARELAEFERKLRQAMGHREAPLGLKSRVMAQARERRQAQRGRWWMIQRVAASVLVAAGIAGGLAAYRQAEERKRGEQAREQVMTAFRITNRTLGKVQQRLAQNDK